MISKASISIDSNAEFRSLLPQNSFRSFCLPPNNTKTSSSVCILIVSSITHIFCISLFIQYFLLSTCNFLTSSHTHINYTLLAHLTHHIFMCYSNQHLSHNIAQSCLSFHLISHSKFFFSSFPCTINTPLYFSYISFFFSFIHNYIVISQSISHFIFHTHSYHTHLYSFTFLNHMHSIPFHFITQSIFHCISHFFSYISFFFSF